MRIFRIVWPPIAPCPTGNVASFGKSLLCLFVRKCLRPHFKARMNLALNMAIPRLEIGVDCSAMKKAYRRKEYRQSGVAFERKAATAVRASSRIKLAVCQRCIQNRPAARAGSWSVYRAWAVAGPESIADPCNIPAELWNGARVQEIH